MELFSTDFSYNLPTENIAFYPSRKRDRSKLLVFDKKNIAHHRFNDIPHLLPPRSTLFFNDTKVIFARLLFKKKHGAKIEILLLNPLKMSKPVEQIMQSLKITAWRCTIGNLKKWKEGTTLHQSKGEFSLNAQLLDREKGHVEFSWQPSTTTFSQIIAALGYPPLPPYIHRKATKEDKERYQTIYSRHEGSVASPTAGLHFSDALIEEIKKKKILTEFLTLHVGSATFRPIREKNVLHHKMHTEQMIITEKTVDTLLLPDRTIIAVGTTSMRVLESLYWLGVKLLEDDNADFTIHQATPYQKPSKPLPSRIEALKAVKLAFTSSQPLMGQTSIFILPGYKFKVCHGLITNFHLPKSTLILLVAAFVGKDWKNIYETALQSNYKFLSYGDTSLLLP